jgi:hypothetical protein
MKDQMIMDALNICLPNAGLQEWVNALPTLPATVGGLAGMINEDRDPAHVLALAQPRPPKWTNGFEQVLPVVRRKGETEEQAAERGAEYERMLSFVSGGETPMAQVSLRRRDEVA